MQGLGLRAEYEQFISLSNESAHNNLDAARDKLYNPKGFADTPSRLAHWLERYEILINAEREQQAIDKKAKKLKRKKSK